MNCKSNGVQEDETSGVSKAIKLINNQFNRHGSDLLKVKNNNVNNDNNNDFHNADINKICNKKRPDARGRWKLLACALRRNSIDSDNGDALDSISQRQFDGLNIVNQRFVSSSSSYGEKIGVGVNNSFVYEIKLINLLQPQPSFNLYEVIVHHVNRQWTAKDLIGFNNTGNICVWPSEEALAYYALENITLFKDSWLLELGGGMTCLAGVMIAKYGLPYLVHLTDGNLVSVDNIKRTLQLNDFDCFIKCSQLKWENVARRYLAERFKYNTIICADCLFFVDSHYSLLDTIEFYLAPRGKAYIMAPKRSNTFDDFVCKAVSRGFYTNIIKNYSHEIWLKHLQLINSHNYNEDIHYPILLILEKRDSTGLTETF